MKSFLAIFTCAENSKNHQAWMKLDSETQKKRTQQGTLAKEQWELKYKNQLRFEGGPLGKQTKLVDAKGIHDIPSQMGYFMIVEAESFEAAAKMFLEHPHFSIFPGDGVEILECQQKS